jgi:hypothetical protein
MSKRSKAIQDQNVALVDLLDKLLEKGAAARGSIAIRLADIDLIGVDLALLITSFSKLAPSGKAAKEVSLTTKEKKYIKRLEEEIKRAQEAIPHLIQAEKPKEIERGIARLVLTLVELLRRLLERESIRQVKQKKLNSGQTQKLGLSLKALGVKMEQMQALFGLEHEDLNLDLGSLGSLL